MKTDKSRVHDEPTQPKPSAGEAEMKTRRQEHHPDGRRVTRSTGGGQRPIRERTGRRREYERRKIRGDLQDLVVERSLETRKTTREMTTMGCGGQRGRDEDEGMRGEEDERRSARSGGGDVAGDGQDDERSNGSGRRQRERRIRRHTRRES